MPLADAAVERPLQEAARHMSSVPVPHTANPCSPRRGAHAQVQMGHETHAEPVWITLHPPDSSMRSV